MSGSFAAQRPERSITADRKRLTAAKSDRAPMGVTEA